MGIFYFPLENRRPLKQEKMLRPGAKSKKIGGERK